MRKTFAGTPDQPRLCVFRSLAEIYAQVIDDEQGHTVAAASTHRPRASQAQVKGLNEDRTGQAWWASLLRNVPNKRASTKVVFDRGGFRYFGRVKALADAAREAGLEF